jgi:hypothetical protein
MRREGAAQSANIESPQSGHVWDGGEVPLFEQRLDYRILGLDSAVGLSGVRVPGPQEFMG